MIIKLTLSRRTYFVGRNGTGHCEGVELMKLTNGESVIISPINSKGETVNCEIAVPLEDIPALIFHLQNITADHYRVRMPDGTYLPDIYRKGPAMRKARAEGGKCEKI